VETEIGFCVICQELIKWADAILVSERKDEKSILLDGKFHRLVWGRRLDRHKRILEAQRLGFTYQGFMTKESKQKRPQKRSKEI
jgi:hypothetical protein